MHRKGRVIETTLGVTAAISARSDRARVRGKGRRLGLFGRGYVPALVLALLGTGLAGFARASAGTEADREQLERLARVTVPFVENQGQLPADVRFSTSTFFGTVSVESDGRLSYGLAARAGGATVTETLVAGSVLPAAGPRAAAGVSYFLGDDPQCWRSDVPSYQEVRLGEVWPGVSVSLRAHARNVEKIFTIQPGGRVERIRLRLGGLGPLSIDRDGALVAAVGERGIRFTPPVAYQERNGLRRPVSVAYTLRGSTYGFRVGDYDHAAPLVVDPVLQSTYIGGANPDSVNAIALDPANDDVLVAGYSYSTGGSGVDGFVARFDPTLTTLLHAAYIGGSGGDAILGIAVHPTTGEVYVAGYTSSSDFSGTRAGAQPATAGSDDGFVARLDASLTRVLSATYLGGGFLDRVVAIAIHPVTGEVYVAGQTSSLDFPGTEGGAQPAAAEDDDEDLRRDGFIARLDTTLGTLLQATYLGGGGRGGPEYLHALAIHPSSGDIYVAGQTLAYNFPGAEGGANAAYYPFTGNSNGFVARLDRSLTRLIQSTYLGSSRSNDIFGIAIHPATGDVYALGWTDQVDLPGTEGGAQPVMAGESDLFIDRLNASLTELFQATYLGGTDVDYGYGIAVHPTRGDIYVTGETYSTDLPGTEQGAEPDRGGGIDGFVVRLDPTLTRVVQATYLGASGDDTPYAIAVQPKTGEVLVAGMTTSPGFPGSLGGSQPSYAGGDDFFGGDGFVTRFPAGLSAASSECVANANTLCLSGARFAVRVDWRVPSQGRSGAGMAVPLSGDTGYFWFFSDVNVELVVKMLDGRAVNGHTWAFYGALTNVEYTITVTDTDTGAVRTYANPSGTLRSVADTSAFADSIGAEGIDPAESAELGAQIDARAAAELYAMYTTLTHAIPPEAATAGPCEAGSVKLCLQQARFQVGVDWSVPSQNRSGHGTAVPVTADTGYFWFFSGTNVELMVKVLDGRGVNGKFWVLYGALSNVQYTITIEDTLTGTVKRYDNASGTLASVADTSAF